MKKDSIVIFDLDGTLSDCSHRLHHIEKHPKNWDAFFAGIPNDPSIPDMVAIHNIFERQGVPIVYVTGRGETHRRASEDWLLQHVIGYPKGTPRIMMRKDGDTRPDYVVKTELYQHLLDAGFHILANFDDRSSNVRASRELGILTLHCANGDFDPYANYKPEPGECLLTLMVGPSGAGKTTFLAEMYHGFNGDIISSDEVRAAMCGDFRDQSKNGEVFTYIKDRTAMNMRYGVPTIIDATHLRRKDRLEHVSLAPGGSIVKYLVIDRPLEDKMRDGGWRLNVTFGDGKKTLVEKHHQQFQSGLKDILKGDGLPNVRVVDYRRNNTGTAHRTVLETLCFIFDEESNVPPEAWVPRVEG